MFFWERFSWLEMWVVCGFCEIVMGLIKFFVLVVVGGETVG